MGTCKLSRPLDQDRYYQLFDCGDDTVHHSDFVTKPLDVVSSKSSTTTTTATSSSSSSSSTIMSFRSKSTTNKQSTTNKSNNNKSHKKKLAQNRVQQKKALRERRKLDAEGSFSCNLMACPWTRALDQTKMTVQSDATSTSSSGTCSSDDEYDTRPSHGGQRSTVLEHDLDRLVSFHDCELFTIQEQGSQLEFEMVFDNSIVI